MRGEPQPTRQAQIRPVCPGSATHTTRKAVTVTRRDDTLVVGTPERDWIRKTIGVRSEATAATLYRQMQAMNLWLRPHSTDPETELLMGAVTLFEEFRPRTTLEAMLLVQMMGVHQAATECLAFATGNTRNDGVREKPMLEHGKLRMNQAFRLMRLFTEQIDAWSLLKGKRGRQKVTVRHVHVHPGGQAIVGSVTGTRRRPLPAREGDPG